MSCLYKIKEAMPTLTATEKKIADYILERPEEVIHASAAQLAASSHTSSAAWVRLAKRLGYKGLPAMKMDLVKDEPQSQEDDLFQAVINEHDSTSELVEKARLFSQKNMAETYSLINTDALDAAIQLLRKAKDIYLIGVGGSGIVCTDLLHKLSRINRNAIYFEDTHLLISRIAHMTSDDVLIAVSYSGNTGVVNTAAQLAKEKGVPVIAITQYNSKTPLAKLADISLYLPIEEGELRLGAIASRNASLALTDLLYLGVMSENIEDAKEKLVLSRELVNEIR